MIEHIETYVAGVTFNNRDGTNRQDILERLEGDEPLKLVWEPNNPHSKSGNAVAVYSPPGQIGYLPEKVVQRIVKKYEGGPKITMTAEFWKSPVGIGFAIRNRKTDDGNDILVADITLTITTVE